MKVLIEAALFLVLGFGACFLVNLLVFFFLKHPEILTRWKERTKR